MQPVNIVPCLSSLAFLFNVKHRLKFCKLIGGGVAGFIPSLVPNSVFPGSLLGMGHRAYKNRLHWMYSLDSTLPCVLFHESLSEKVLFGR